MVGDSPFDIATARQGGLAAIHCVTTGSHTAEELAAHPKLVLAFDVVLILEKGREKLTSLAIELDAERAPEPPKVFTRVRFIYHLKGYGLKPAAVERAINLSAEKYCSASAMIAKTAKIEHSWTISEEGPPAEA